MIGIRTLAILYWAVRLGGFGRAAARLNMTQPSVSARIAALEAEYGVRLFDRERGSRPVLTRKGAELFAQASRMLALQAEAVAGLRDAGGLHGTIRIGVAETLVQLLLPDILRRLHAEHPAVTPDVMTDISPNGGARRRHCRHSAGGDRAGTGQRFAPPAAIGDGAAASAIRGLLA